MHGGGACQETLAKGRLSWKLKQELGMSLAHQRKLRMQLLMWLEIGAKLLPATTHAMCINKLVKMAGYQIKVTL